MIKYRKYQHSDLDEINRLNRQQDFDIENLDHGIIDGIIESNSDVVAYGIVKKQAEAVILLDKTKPRLTRAKALKELMKVAIFGAKKDNCEQLYCFTSNPEIVRLLTKHFGFRESKETVLVLELDNGKEAD